MHVKVRLLLLQPYNEVEITDNVEVAVIVLALAVLELSVHWIPFPWSPGTATSVAELHASLGPVMVGGAGSGYMVTVCVPAMAAGQVAPGNDSVRYSPVAKVPLKVAALPVPFNVAPENGALSWYN